MKRADRSQRVVDAAAELRAAVGDLWPAERAEYHRLIGDELRRTLFGGLHHTLARRRTRQAPHHILAAAYAAALRVHSESHARDRLRGGF